MKKSKKAESKTNFNTNRLAITIVLIAVLIVGGWLIYNHHETTTKKANTKSTSVAQEIAKTYNGWKTYSSNGVSIQYPSSWSLNTSSSITTFSSSTDSKTKLKYVITFYRYTDNPTSPVNDTVISSLPLGIFGIKPIYLLMLDSKNSLGTSVTGLYVSNTNAKSGSAANETGGFVSSKNVQYILSASLISASGNSSPEPLTSYINNPNYLTVVNILRSVKD